MAVEFQVIADSARRKEEVEAIRSQHKGEHVTQPCNVGASPCDVHVLLAEIDALRAKG